MTLTGRLEGGDATLLMLKEWFAPALGKSDTSADIEMFEQPCPGTDFSLRYRIALLP